MNDGVIPLYKDAHFIARVLFTIASFSLTWYFASCYDSIEFLRNITDQETFRAVYYDWMKFKQIYPPFTIISLASGVTLLATVILSVFAYRDFWDNVEQITYEIPKPVIIKKVYKGVPRKPEETQSSITALIVNAKENREYGGNRGKGVKPLNGKKR
jgi:hypothetical protein